MTTQATLAIARTRANMDWNECQQCINPYINGSAEAMAYADEYSKIRFKEIFGD